MDDSAKEEQVQQGLWEGGNWSWARCTNWAPYPGQLVFFRSQGWEGECIRFSASSPSYLAQLNLGGFTWTDGSGLNDNVGSWLARPAFDQAQRVTICQHGDCVVCWGGDCNNDNNLHYDKGPTSNPDTHGNPALWGVSAFVLNNRH